MYRILVVDDEPRVCDTLCMMIRRLGHEPYSANKGETGVKMFRRHRPHLTLLDLGLPDTDGLAVFKRIRALVAEAPTVIVTGGSTEEQEVQVRQLGVSDFLLKGFSLGVLRDTVDRVLNQKN